jgi:ATP phosphoribosyltransferase
VCEAARPVERRLDLGFGECRLIAAAREDSVIKTRRSHQAPDRDFIPGHLRFLRARNQNVEIVAIGRGGNRALRASPVIVDIVDWPTLRVNGLLKSDFAHHARSLSRRRGVRTGKGGA